MKNLKTVCSVILFVITASHFNMSVARADGLAQQYVHARNLLEEVPGTAADLTVDQASPAPVTRMYELSGTISGVVSVSGSPTVLLTCPSKPGSDKGVEFAVSQQFLDASSNWMSTDSTVRVLVQSLPSADGSSGANALTLYAAGPESDVSDLEKQLSALVSQLRSRVQAQGGNRQYSAETSRSASMSSRYLSSDASVSGLSDRASAIYPSYHNMISRLNPRLGESTVSLITKSILSYADEYQLDPRLIIAMIVAESGFDPYSVSRTGAAGLGQLMPGTAAELGVTDRFDPQQNIAAAVHILSGHVQEYGGAAPCGVIPLNTLLLTMAAYNAGAGAVKKYGGVPPYRETQNYVRRVSELYRQLCGT
jgi:soluble lytic murein transglycosylase-like protein